MKSKIELIPAVVSVAFVNPTFMANTICPLCDNLESTEITIEYQNKKVMHSCSTCSKEYMIAIPKFSTVMQSETKYPIVRKCKTISAT